MADIQFDEPQFTVPQVSQGPKGLSGLIIKWGMAKDEAGAQKVLLGTLAVCVVLIIGTYLFTGSPAAHVPPPPAP